MAPWEKYRSGSDGGPWHKYAKPPAEEPPSIVEDVAKSAGSGVLEGAHGLAGIGGDLESAIQRGGSFVDNTIRGWLGAEPAPEPLGKTFLPSSQDWKNLTGYEGSDLDYQPKTTAGEFAKTVGEFVPGGGMAGALVRGGVRGVASGAARYGAVPGATSEAAGQLTEGTAFEPYARLAGALVGPSVAHGARRLATPFPASPGRTAAADTLRNEGVTSLTAGQTTGSKPLRYFESEMGGHRAADMVERQGEQYTAAVLRRVGENANRATPEVIDRAFTRIGGEFDGLAARNGLVPDQQLMNDMAGVVGDYQAVVPPAARAGIIEATVRDVGNAIAALGRSGQPFVDGRAYQALRSRLDKAARGARVNDPQLSEALYGMRNSLDDAMERGIGGNNPADLGAWQEARRQYRNMLVVEKAATGAGEVAAEGIITPARLRQATVSQSRRGYARGQGDFSDLARAGEEVMSPLPDSGTASRLAARGVPAMVGGLLGGHLGDFPGAVAGLTAGPMAKALVGRGVLSRGGRAYLGNQRFPRGREPNPYVVYPYLADRSQREQRTP